MSCRIERRCRVRLQILCKHFQSICTELAGAAKRCRLCFAYLQVSAAFPELFAAAGVAAADMRADAFGAARAALARAAFRALTLNPEWRGQLAAVARGLADVLSRRSRGDGVGDASARDARRRTREAALAALAVHMILRRKREVHDFCESVQYICKS